MGDDGTNDDVSLEASIERLYFDLCLIFFKSRFATRKVLLTVAILESWIKASLTTGLKTIWRLGIRKKSEPAKLKVLTPAKVLMFPSRKELGRIPLK